MKFREVRALRHAGMLLVVVSTLAAGIAPDWSRVLKAQGYYGMVDLSLSMTSGAELVAGGDADFLLQAENRGPDDARRARTMAGFSGAVAFGATSGCINDPSGFPQCVFSTPLNVGGTADYLLHATLPPTARGDVQLAVAVTSDDEEINAGDEVVIYHKQIAARLDAETTAQCDALHVRSGLPFTCHVRFTNHGPSAAHFPSLGGYVGTYHTTWSCQASRPALCPAPQQDSHYLMGTPEWLMPGEQVTFMVTAVFQPEIDWNRDLIEFSAIYQSFSNGNETETNPGNESRYLQIPVSLFFDSFDGN